METENTNESDMANHVSVLLQEAIESMDLVAGDYVLDCTLGSGGHTRKICEMFGKNINIVAIDADGESIDRAKVRLEKLDCNVQFFAANFRDIDAVAKESEIDEFDAILFDLGWNLDQFEKSGRGFSFQNDEVLDMRFGDEGRNAKDIVNTSSESELEQIIREYGEEKQARNIARSIVEMRKLKPITTTTELVRAIEKGYRGKYPKNIHYATKTFQALRIATNDEIGALAEGLQKGFALLKPGGRMTVIAFHSIEDRIVKNFMRKKANEEIGTVIFKKPVVPSQNEIDVNPRARSAKLRTIEKNEKN